MQEPLERKWNAKWIADLDYQWPDDESPIPTLFQKTLILHGDIKEAALYITALGIYEAALDGKKIGKDWFAPGFTSYRHQIQYQTYDVTNLLAQSSVLTVTVAGGWAVGSFLYERKTRLAASHTALLAELCVTYADGSTESIGTDTSWQVTQDGPVRMAEWYNGETYDATRSLRRAVWHKAQLTHPEGHPRLLAQYGAPVRTHQQLSPVSCTQSPEGEWIYDFGQNFAGVICARITGKAGQEIVFRHSEILYRRELFVENLRTAKATATYICRDGIQEYTPHFTYMGFHYVGVRGIEPNALTLTAWALYSDIAEIGSFRCSNERLNRLQQNILWSARSNLVDIPTDCPQRDERMGWTGDIALFASTACFNFDLSRFFEKWLRDLSAEQTDDGSLPMTVPQNGYDTCKAVACWGDSCILVPWAEYLARGDLALLRKLYPTMKKFLSAAAQWASVDSSGLNRYIWEKPFQYGDWAAPGGDYFDWIARGPWMATAFFANSCGIAARIAELLEEEQDVSRYRTLREKICAAYREVFTDGHGRLKQEFQTGYVLPLWFGMVEGEEADAMAANLDRLIAENGNRLATGFPGTPYILFALSDHGYWERAYQLLLQEECPSWLYEIKMGATTIWERWDGLQPDGTPNPDGMVSFNHYAYGAVGDWLYRRVLGLESLTGGYKTFRVAPMPGGGLTWAEGSTKTPYGCIHVRWEIVSDQFRLSLHVPKGTSCEVHLPHKAPQLLDAGDYSLCTP